MGSDYLAPWNPNLLWPNAVEAFGVLEEGLVSSIAHVLDDPAG